MHLSLALLFLLTLAQAPPLTKAEQFQEAARKGDVGAVKKLLDEGVDVNTKFRYDVTALIYACDHGHLDVVKVLLERGADMSARDTFYGLTPLAIATAPAQQKKAVHTEIAALLIEKGAPDKQDALLWVSQSGDTALVKVILDAGDLPPDVLSSALELAMAAQQAQTAALLEARGAKPYQDFKMDGALLAKLPGTYRSASGSELTLIPAGARITLGPPDAPPEQRLTMVATGPQAFKAIGAQVAISLQVEGERVTSFSSTQGSKPAVVYVRVEGK